MIVSVGLTAPIDDEEAGVDDVEVVELVGLAVHVEYRRRRIGAEPDRARLVRGGGDVHAS